MMDDVFERIIRGLFPNVELPFWKRRLMKWAFGYSRLSRVVPQDDFMKEKGTTWVARMLSVLHFCCETHPHDFKNIPARGPVIVIANHPTVMDGMALVHTVASVRKDIKIVSNHLLPMIFPQISELTIGIQNMAGKVGLKKFKEMNEHLKNGGVLIICPAGKLASWSLSGLKEHDWKPGFLQLAIRNNAALVPLYISGRNSMRYYLTATFWRQLSNLMIIRESLRHRGKTLQIKIGQQIDLRSLHLEDEDHQFIASHCLKHLQSMGNLGPALVGTIPPEKCDDSRSQLITALKPCKVLKEFSDGKKILVYRYANEESSPVINELGILREKCYREIGAGTGKLADNDVYDNNYYHILLWDPCEAEIIGAYRVIPVAELLAQQGITGLYSNTLFTYHDSAYEYLEKSMELGRGFIQKKYQKTNALDYLWQGIFCFLTCYPECKYLLGVLTIPATYPTDVQQLIVAFYNIYFPAENEICSPVEPFLVEDENIHNVFSSENFSDDWLVLNGLLKKNGYELPWPYKQAAKWFSPGGSSINSFTQDRSFNSIAGLNLSSIDKLNKIYSNHYLKNN